MITCNTEWDSCVQAAGYNEYCYLGLSLGVFVQDEEVILQKLEEFCRNLMADGSHLRCLIHNIMELYLMIKGMNCNKPFSPSPFVMPNSPLAFFKTIKSSQYCLLYFLINDACTNLCIQCDDFI